jgi:hypothetical protein
MFHVERGSTGCFGANFPFYLMFQQGKAVITVRCRAKRNEND